MKPPLVETLLSNHKKDYTMSDELKPNQLPTTEDEASSPLDIVTDLALDSTIPAPIRKNALKALDRLCSAVIDLPVGALERRFAEKQAESEARIRIREEITSQIIQQIKVDPEYARIAANKYGDKIIREQISLDKISAIAANEVKKEQSGGSTDSTADSGEERTINDDWLNSFEEEARQKSTKEMQVLFGRILAGEIKKPGSYSIKTVKLLGELDQSIAILFKKLCSACIVSEIPAGGPVLDIRVPSLGGNAGSNALKKYGLGFDQLNILNEYGLIISDYNSWRDYKLSIVNEKNQVLLPFRHQGRYWALLPLPDWKRSDEFRVSGVMLSRAGHELIPIVDQDPMQEYIENLKKFFAGKDLIMTEIPSQNIVLTHTD